MGLLGMIGKMAGSKVVEKVGSELTKKQNREQANKYCTYISNNLARISNALFDLQSETQELVGNFSSVKGFKLSFKERGDFKKAKNKATKNLQYLYLSRDFFTAISKNASGLSLQNEELMLISKFAPYFDGVPVLDMVDDDSDDSLLGTFKEARQEIMAAFVSPPKNPNHFDFSEYLYRYKAKLDEYIFPDVASAIESFKNAMEAQDTHIVTNVAPAVAPPITPTVTASFDEAECPSCHFKLTANSKFCPECGNKIEMKQTSFCTHCGKEIDADSNFCSHCGKMLQAR